MEWTQEQENNLFALHAQLGNKWTLIGSTLNISDNTIKNKFYSTLRKGLRKLNSYIGTIKHKRQPQLRGVNKYLKMDLITKLIAVSGNSYYQCYEVKPRAIEMSADIENQLIQMARLNKTYQVASQQQFHFEDQVLGKIQEFGKNIKKRKGKFHKKAGDTGKSKNSKAQQSSEQMEEQNQHELNQPEKQQKKNDIIMPVVSHNWEYRSKPIAEKQQSLSKASQVKNQTSDGDYIKIKVIASNKVPQKLQQIKQSAMEDPFSASIERFQESVDLQQQSNLAASREFSNIFKDGTTPSSLIYSRILSKQLFQPSPYQLDPYSSFSKTYMNNLRQFSFRPLSQVSHGSNPFNFQTIQHLALPDLCPSDCGIGSLSKKRCSEIEQPLSPAVPLQKSRTYDMAPNRARIQQRSATEESLDCYESVKNTEGGSSFKIFRNDFKF